MAGTSNFADCAKWRHYQRLIYIIGVSRRLGIIHFVHHVMLSALGRIQRQCHKGLNRRQAARAIQGRYRKGLFSDSCAFIVHKYVHLYQGECQFPIHSNRESYFLHIMQEIDF